MHIVYVSDGKAGHRSQALGLYHAMQRQHSDAVILNEIALDDLSIFSLISAWFNKSISILKVQPDYIVGVGSHTQLRVLLLGKLYPKAKTVIMMKPNFPFSWFDYAIIPEHDGIAEQGNVIVTKGALNPIVNEQRHQANRILIALGGSSKRHQWNEVKVLDSIQHIIANHPQAEIILTTSRRTPNHFLAQLKQQPYNSSIQVFPVEETAPGWIFDEMQKAEAVWVTEDSISMIYEALTAGCKVGVILVDRLKGDRITQSIDTLLQYNTISVCTRLSDLPTIAYFQEANRVTEILCTQSLSSTSRK